MTERRLGGVAVSAATELLVAEGLRRSRGRTFQLAVDRLTLRAGEILCVLGPTGAGKSTLLRLLAGIERPDEGCVTWPGGDGAGRRGRPLLVPQRPLLVTGTVRYNVALGLRFRKTATAELTRLVDRVAERLELTALLDRPARQLSGGETRLVALARALVLEPDVLLVDEPTADLDPGRGALVERVLTETARRRGAGVVWTTHNLFQARRVATTVMLLCGGEVVEVGPAEAFFRTPRTPLARRFLEGELLY